MEEQKAEISINFKSLDGETSITYSGDPKHFPGVISHIGHVSGGSIRPSANLPAIQPILPPAQPLPMLQQSAYLDLNPGPTLALPPSPPAEIAPTQIHPKTVLQLPKIKKPFQFVTSALSMGIILGILTIFVRSPVAQKNLNRLWLDATKSTPTQPAKPIKK
jgi:hypothetical protein